MHSDGVIHFVAENGQVQDEVIKSCLVALPGLYGRRMLEAESYDIGCI